MEFLLYAGALALVFVCVITLLVILMQRPSANAGMGAALGGGAAEQAFGGEAGNVLTKATTTLIIVFFLLSFGLFLGFKNKFSTRKNTGASVLQSVSAESKQEVAPAPTLTAPVDKKPEAAAPATTHSAPAGTSTAPARQ